MTHEKKSISKSKFNVLRLSEFYNKVRDPKNFNQNLPQDAINYIWNNFAVMDTLEVKGETYFVVKA